MVNKSKLYRNTGATFELPHYVDMLHRVISKEAADIPMITWPDGTWCFTANVYILKLYEKNLSRKNRGGSLLAYATNISHLLRYVFDNKIQLTEMSDNQFCLFIKMLQGERKPPPSNVLVRDANTVIAIGRNCLDFLETVGKLYQIQDFVGVNGQIKGEKNHFEVKRGDFKKGKNKIARKCWDHRIFPYPSPKNKRHPISSENINKIRRSILSLSSSIFLRKRRYVMVKLLEITGGRRSEVAALTCNSVINASKMAEPMLELLTAKKGGSKDVYRLIPIASHDVEFLLEFIETNRRKIIRKTCGQSNDDGYVFISETTGKKIRPNTITQEISILAKAADITEKACPHMFRHRFITKLFVALIEQHEFENIDSFRRALLDSESLKQKVQQWTGHSNLNSLDTYIDLAYEELSNFKKSYNIVSTKMALGSFKTTLMQLKAELEIGEDPKKISFRLNNLIDAFERDINKSNG